MAIEGQDEDILSDEELERQQRIADGEDVNANPVVGAEDAKTAAAPAASPVPTPEPTAPPASTTAAAAPAAGAEDDAKGTKVVGVASKDGTGIIPYSALQAERRNARSANARADRAEQELAAAQQQLTDLKSGKAPIADVTEDDVKQMEADFPDKGKQLRALWERAQHAAPAPAPAPKSGEDENDAQTVTQEAIDQIPTLLAWQHDTDTTKFARAQEIDAVLLKSPKWAGKPAVERFAAVTEMVAEEFDLQFENPFKKAKASTSASPAAPAASPAAASTDPAQAAARKPPESLSDFKGGVSADHGTIDVARATPQALVNRMSEMSDEEIDAHLAKYG